MRINLFGLFCLLSLAVSAQTSFLRISEDQAMTLAAAQGDFIILDFYANWCGPCKAMDGEVWSRDTVKAIQRNFVNVRLDGSASFAPFKRYGVSSIPALIIMDANGNEYARYVGYLKEDEVLEILADFPRDMSGPYAADIVSQEQPTAFSSHLLRARHYQKVARQAGGAVAVKLAHQSNVSVEQAMGVLGDKAEQSASMVQYLELMQAENLILKGRAKKALKALAALEKGLDNRHIA
ncbi:MAG: thioredoxin fold domain-containing protein, partial [Bacteroidota bacterium]